MTGAERILAERTRQIEELGYDVDHDAHHDDSDLAFAAACYAAPATVYLVRVEPDVGDPETNVGRVRWVEPWPAGWNRPDRDITDPANRIEELTKAGALAAAEIDRILAIEGLEALEEGA